MQWDVALYDLVAPYILRGAPLGPIHAAISALYVQDYDDASSADAVVIRGTAQFSGEAGGFIDPQTMSFGVNAANVEGHPRDDDGRRDPWIDLRDSNIRFELRAPRAASAIAAGAMTPPGGIDADLLALLDALDPTPLGPGPSDYVSTEFTLDMVVTAAVLRFPFLKGAELLPDGRLVPIAGDDRVEIFLPRFKLRLVQGSDGAQPLDISLTSFGVEGLDDPADIGTVDLVRMEPPYAFLGDTHTVGIGFRGATLDVSRQSTPPEILEQFGMGETWTGLHFPELRLFVAPNGLEDFAVSASAENLLIGWGAEPGVTGDFGIAVINQGDGNLRISARFVDAGGRLYGITPVSETTAQAQIPPQATMVVDVEGGRAPYTVSMNGASGRVHAVDLGPERSAVFTVTVSDASAPQKNATLAITATPYRAQVVVTPGRIGAVEIIDQESLRNGQPVDLPVMYIASQSERLATLGLAGVLGQVSWNGGPEVEIAEGEQVEVSATITQPGTAIPPMPAFFHYDRPDPHLNQLDDYVGDPDKSHTTPAMNQGPSSDWMPGGTPVMESYRTTLAALDPGTTISIAGTASMERDDEMARSYNYDLSVRRARAFERLIETANDGEFAGRFTFDITPPEIPTPQEYNDWLAQWLTQGENRNTHWRATATVLDAPVPDIVTTATLRRAVGEPAVIEEVPDLPPDEPEPPDWFRSVAVKVRIVKNSFVALEVSGAIDFATAAEQRMQEGLLLDPSPPAQPPQINDGVLVDNPADGIVDYRILVQVDDAAQVWTVSAALGADPADVDGLLLAGALPGQVIAESNPALNMLGITTAMAPVLASTAPDNPLDGDVGALVLTGTALAIPSAMAALGWLRVQRVILYGGELVVRDRPTGPEVNMFFDVETDISVDISIAGGDPILTIPENNPLKVRYKSVGVRMGYTPETGDRFQFRPVFDSSKGYSIGVEGPGGLQVNGPLSRILKVLAARIARQNPMTFEIDLGFSVDLGVISVDRARVRVPIHPSGPPELTAMAASIDIPAVLRASGYLEIGSTPGPNGGVIGEVRGGLDLTLVPIKLRIKAEVAVANIPESEGGPATGVAVSIDVTFPAPIPLGSSGLGLLGVLGLFAMHYGRNETTQHQQEPTPALAWLEATGGNPTRLSGDGGEDFWTPQIGNWAFGVGAVLGTAEGGVIFNLKGVFLLEIPGPRILLMMKAAMLTPPPAVEGLEEAAASLLAVIDLDAGRGTLSIGIVAEYGAEPLVKVRIPVEAFWNLRNRREWHIFLGRADDPIHAEVIMVFEGSGYFMISGNGFPELDLFEEKIDGRLGIALGMHVELIWGSREARIYASVAGGFDALMGFDPFFLRGKLVFRGELRLIIISISAYAGLDVWIGEDPGSGQDVARLEGEICGKVDFFFFEIEGCVDFAMGEHPAPPIPPLIDRLAAVSRSPALLAGSGADAPIDAVLSTAIRQGGNAAPGAGDFVEPSQADEEDTRPRRIPIDAVLALSLTAPPRQNTFDVLGESFDAHAPGSKADGYTKRGSSRVYYELTGVELVAGGLTEGDVPATWWDTAPEMGDPELTQLALLTYTPFPFSSAIERSEFLNQIITDRWGTVCHDPAPAAPVLWAFHHEKLGPSAIGWSIEGTEWPDPEDSQRSEEVETGVEIYEAWRSGHPTDGVRGILPGVILGNSIPCAQPQDDPQIPGAAVAINPALLRAAAARLPVEAARVPARERLRQPVAQPLRQPARVPDRAALRLNPALAARQAEADTRAFAAEMARFTGPSGREFRASETLTTALARTETASRLIREGTATLDRSAFDALSGLAPPSAPAAPPAPDPAPPRDPIRCDSRILSAPEFDTTEPISPMGDATQESDVLEGWAETGFAPSTLGCAIRIRSGGIASGHLLLVSHREVLEREALIVRVLNEAGDEILRRVLNDGAIVSPMALEAELPPRWRDTEGPWFADVEHAINFDPSFVSVHDPMELLLIDLPEVTAAEIIEIGIDYDRLTRGGRPGIDRFLSATLGGGVGAAHPLPGLGVTPSNTLAQVPNRLTRFFYVLCFELTRMGEVVRQDHDEQMILSTRTTLGEYLSADAGTVALLQPDTLYGLRVNWLQNNEGDAPEEENETFWFHTTAEPPARLDAYMLFTLPNPRETHVFGSEPLTLVFSTPQVVNLYAAFGLDLQIRLRAASFRQPAEEDLPEGETYPFPVNAETTEGLGPLVLTPLEETMEEVLGGQCIPINESRIRHLMRLIDLPLDPLTDYVLDIMGVPEGGAVTDPGTMILHSVAFSTGAYPTLDRFARVLQSQRGNHRWVEDGAMAAVALDFPGDSQPEGAALDAAMIAAGLEAMPVPDRPETTVFWEQAGPAVEPQPVAILIDANEPMRRLWDLPVKVVDSEADPVSEYWDRKPHVWLDLEEGAETPGRIDKILRDPGGQRALVLLNPGARGARVQIEMVRYPVVETMAEAAGNEDLEGPGGDSEQRFAVVDLRLDRAPWEE